MGEFLSMGPENKGKPEEQRDVLPPISVDYLVKIGDVTEKDVKAVRSLDLRNFENDPPPSKPGT